MPRLVDREVSATALSAAGHTLTTLHDIAAVHGHAGGTSRVIIAIRIVGNKPPSTL